MVVWFRKKNVLSVLMQCISVACLASVLWLVIGYSLAFGDGNQWIGDTSKMFLSGVGRDTLSGDIPETAFFAFQMTFAVITPALIVGAYVERIKFSAVLLFSGLWLLIVYAPVTHWIWAGNGWLFQAGLLDFGWRACSSFNSRFICFSFSSYAWTPFNISFTG